MARRIGKIPEFLFESLALLFQATKLRIEVIARLASLARVGPAKLPNEGYQAPNLIPAEPITEGGHAIAFAVTNTGGELGVFAPALPVAAGKVGNRGEGGPAQSAGTIPVVAILALLGVQGRDTCRDRVLLGIRRLGRGLEFKG